MIAVSATNLQGFLLAPRQREQFARFRARKPLAVLGQSLYVFPATDSDADLLRPAVVDAKP